MKTEALTVHNSPADCQGETGESETMAKQIRYTYKYPRTSWADARETFNSRKRMHWYSLEKAVRDIEWLMRPGYTSEPYMQLIEVPPDGPMRVISERTQRGWLTPLEAAGFVARRVA